MQINRYPRFCANGVIHGVLERWLMSLTDTEIRKAKPGDRPVKLMDGRVSGPKETAALRGSAEEVRRRCPYARSGAVYAGPARSRARSETRLTMFSFFKRTTKAAVKSTPLSEFVRSKSADKKQVYVAALKRASESQNKVVERAHVRRKSAAAARG